MGGENRTVLIVMVVGGERGVAMHTSSLFRITPSFPNAVTAKRHQASSCYDQHSLHDNVITHALPFS